MESTIQVAIIGAVAIVISAIVSAFFSLYSIRKTTEATKDIELLKHSIEKRNERETLELNELLNALNGLKEGSESIQKVKDEIQLLLSSRHETLLCQDFLNRFKIARENLVQTFQKNQAYLQGHDYKSVHLSKNLSFNLEAIIEEALNNHEYVPNIGGEFKDKLLDYRLQLTDFQNYIRESRTTKLISHTLASN